MVLIFFLIVYCFLGFLCYLQWQSRRDIQVLLEDERRRGDNVQRDLDFTYHFLSTSSEEEHNHVFMTFYGVNLWN